VSVRRLPSAALALAACACAGGAPVVEPVATVDGAQRELYWVDRSPYNILGPQPCEPGIVTAEYVIGDNGRVRDVDIVASRPRLPKNEYAVKNELWERRFDPGPENSQQHAIRVIEDFRIDCGPGRPKWR